MTFIAVACVAIGSAAFVLGYLLVALEGAPGTVAAPWIHPSVTALSYASRLVVVGVALGLLLMIVRLIDPGIAPPIRFRLIGAVALCVFAASAYIVGRRLGHPYFGAAAAMTIASFLPVMASIRAATIWVAALLASALAVVAAANAIWATKTSGAGIAIVFVFGIGLAAVQAALVLWGTIAALLMTTRGAADASVEQAHPAGRREVD